MVPWLRKSSIADVARAADLPIADGPSPLVPENRAFQLRTAPLTDKEAKDGENSLTDKGTTDCGRPGIG